MEQRLQIEEMTIQMFESSWMHLAMFHYQLTKPLACFKNSEIEEKRESADLIVRETQF